MKRLTVLAVALMLIVSLTFVFAAEGENVTEKTKDFVKDIAQKKGVKETDVEDIKEVNLTALPEQIKFETIDETNLALYQLKIRNETNPLFILSAGGNLIEKQTPTTTNKFLLNLGLNEEVTEDTFLNTGAGVKTSLEKGYVLTESGSITGISTSLEITNGNTGDMIEIVIYKNGREIGFRNTFIIGEKSVEIDYDSISKGTIKFSEGDIISLKVSLSDGVRVKDINTLLELTA